MRVVVDTSALVAMLFDEGEGDRFARILATSTPSISAGTLIELLHVVTLRRTEAMRAEVQALLTAFEIEVVPVDTVQVDYAADGHLRFGKGRSQQPAVLNFGDLFAYALARRLDAPLLFKGEDFAATDVRPAA